MAAELRREGPSLPIGVLPIRRTLFPAQLATFAIGKPRSVALLEEILDEIGVETAGALSASQRQRSEALLACVLLREGESGDDLGRGLASIGCRLRILEVRPVAQLAVARRPRLDSALYMVTVQGVERVHLEAADELSGRHVRMRATRAVDQEPDLEKTANFASTLRGLAEELERQLSELPATGGAPGSPKVPSAVQGLSDAAAMLSDALKADGGSARRLDGSALSALTDAMAAVLDATPEEKQAVLECGSVGGRAELVASLLKRQLEVFKLTQKLSATVKGQLSKTQREFWLKQQLKAIQDELKEGGGGDDDAGRDEVGELTARLAEAPLTPEARAAADRELRRLKQMQPMQAEHAVLLGYLEWICCLPWKKMAAQGERIDLARAQAALDAEHHGLAKVKRRITEHLAVLSLRGGGAGGGAGAEAGAQAGAEAGAEASGGESGGESGVDGVDRGGGGGGGGGAAHGPILCLLGPPGVGKTSLGKSIAAALGRPFERISLGGVYDAADIRGHRRTYVGALPGLFVQAMRRAGASNPVLMLDEVDKLGRDGRSDPTSALLEVLDPAQNERFVDHYLNVPLDLSKVVFVATANSLDTVPPPLLDRMEVLEMGGYTLEEKCAIATRHVLPRQLLRNGLPPASLSLPEPTLTALINGYTREAGLRNLEREVASLCRSLAARYAAAAEGDERAAMLPVEVGVSDLQTSLGPCRFEREAVERGDRIGVAIGLAWTPVGGELLFIETSRMGGRGELLLTGQLGDVMQESVRTALSWIRALSSPS